MSELIIHSDWIQKDIPYKALFHGKGTHRMGGVDSNAIEVRTVKRQKVASMSG